MKKNLVMTTKRKYNLILLVNLLPLTKKFGNMNFLIMETRYRSTSTLKTSANHQAQIERCNQSAPKL